MDKDQALERYGKAYEPGTVLYNEGDAGSKLWIIHEGHVQLTRRISSEDVLLEVLGPGEFCGELSLVSGGPQPTTATVVDKAKLIVVDASQFESMVRANGELSVRMMKKLAGRLNEAYFRVSAMQMRNTLGRVMLQIRHELAHSMTPSKAMIPSNVAALLGIDEAELKDALNKLVAKNLITLGKDNVVAIVDDNEYGRFLNYLELHDRYSFLDK